jgi:acetyltransferase-like isoleucine patch superfamily enzyme
MKAVSILPKLAALCEFSIIYVVGKVLGISYVVRYLRNPNPLVSCRLLRAFSAQIGKNTTFKRSIYIDNSYEDRDSKGDFSNLRIGNNCYIGDSVFFDLANIIEIDDNCVISAKVSFITHQDCNRSEYLQSKFPRVCKSVRLKHDSWIGLNATLLPGTIVEENVVVAASSLVRGELNQNGLYAGIPAILKRKF